MRAARAVVPEPKEGSKVLGSLLVLSKLRQNAKITLHIETCLTVRECLNCGRKNVGCHVPTFFTQPDDVWDDDFYKGLKAVKDRCRQSELTGHLVSITMQDRGRSQHTIYRSKAGQKLTLEALRSTREKLREVRLGDYVPRLH